MPTTITVSFDKDRADYAVSFAGMISHRISQAQIDKALALLKESSWQRSLRDANALGAELFRMYSDASPAGAVIASGQGLRTHNIRKTIHKTLSRSSVRVLEQGFVGRRRQIQQGVRVLRGTEDRRGLLITGTAGIGKSCLQ